jgi:hypothetical protein
MVTITTITDNILLEEIFHAIIGNFKTATDHQMMIMQNGVANATMVSIAIVKAIVIVQTRREIILGIKPDEIHIIILLGSHVTTAILIWLELRQDNPAKGETIKNIHHKT